MNNIVMNNYQPNHYYLFTLEEKHDDQRGNVTYLCESDVTITEMKILAIVNKTDTITTTHHDIGDSIIFSKKEIKEHCIRISKKRFEDIKVKLL